MTSIKTILVSAPSGAGKSSFVERLCREEPRLVDIVTYTTRQPRPGEKNGDPYYFVSEAEFLRLREQGFFLEWAKVHEFFYGTPWDQLQAAWRSGRVVIIDIDVQGADSFRQKIPEGLKTIFILPPSLEELERRLLRRSTHSPEDLRRRLENARKEMEQASRFDHQIVNDEFEPSYQKFKILVQSWLDS